jgi:prepilin-type processing-associated H-X9-DG protein
LVAAAVPVLLFQCPAVGQRRPVLSAIEHPPRPAMDFENPIAPTDYEAILGLKPDSINPHLGSEFYDNNNRYSVLHRNSRNGFQDIPDGASNTIMVVECGGRPDVFRVRRLHPELYNDQGIGWADSEGPFSLDGANRDGSAEGLGPESGCDYSMNRKNDNEPYSFHSGGCNFLFADGHINFVAESIELTTMAQLVTRAANEIVEEYE